MKNLIQHFIIIFKKTLLLSDKQNLVLGRNCNMFQIVSLLSMPPLQKSVSVVITGKYCTAIVNVT